MFAKAYGQSGYPSTGTKPDNFEHTFCWGSSFGATAMRTAASAAMANLDAQSPPYFDTAVATCSTSTDVVWEVGVGAYANTGYWGMQTCFNGNAAGECERSQIWLDPNHLTTANVRRQAACHELGHSLGLTHDQTDCMWNGANPSGSLVTMNGDHLAHLQGSHDSPIGHVDAVYRTAQGIAMSGWLDPDVRFTPAPEIHVRIDVTWFYFPAATNYRQDLANAFPFWGAAMRSR